jgi:hypothetical protein
MERGHDGFQHQQQRGQHQYTVRSRLTPEQLRVASLFRQCGVSLDESTFLGVWKLADLGVKPEAVVTLLRDVARYSGDARRQKNSRDG